MKELMKRSIEIPGRVLVVYPFNQEEVLDVSEVRAKFNGAVYCMNNSTLAYLTEDGRFFVTPYTRKAIRTLDEEGFKEEYFYVPFSNGDYPKAESAKWFELRELAQISYREDYKTDIAKYCDEHGFGELAAATLANCFIIPTNGVHVRHPNFEQTNFPVCNESCVDCTVVDNVGGYCTNNGRVVFIYRDGHTYVCKGYGILDELRAAGYKERSIFVPFSNGEEITDLGLKARWDALRKF